MTSTQAEIKDLMSLRARKKDAEGSRAMRNENMNNRNNLQEKKGA
jgi:hypothetical protein